MASTALVVFLPGMEDSAIRMILERVNGSMILSNLCAILSIQ